MNETWQTILSSHRRKSRLYQHYRIHFHSHAADPKLVFLASDPLNSGMPSALSFRITLDSNALARLLPPPSLGTVINVHSTSLDPSLAAFALCDASLPDRSSLSPQYAHPSPRLRT